MSATMMALVRRGNQARLEERPVPALLDGRDALVRVTLSTICTSDLHILHGAVPRARDGVVLGHEFVGEVVAVGERVNGLRPGQRVAANCITFCGDCWFCRQGYINNCERGGWELGCRIDGCQAEYVRVPFADSGLTPIPDGVSDEKALLLGDILASGYFGAELCAIRPGDTVAVIGAGPVGLCAMLCARLFGAAEVIALVPRRPACASPGSGVSAGWPSTPGIWGRPKPWCAGRRLAGAPTPLSKPPGERPASSWPGGWPGPTRWWPWSPCMSGSRFCPCPPCTGKT